MTKDAINRLPEEVGKSIPAGEKIWWSGTPAWMSFGYHAFGIKYLLIYFILSAFYAVSQIKLSFSFSAFLVHYIPFMLSGIITGLMLFLLAYIAARHTCYVITEKRVVIRTGIALVFLLNMPLKNIISIDKQNLSNGCGNLSFKIQSKKRIPYFSCWPSVRVGSFLEPIPAFRSVAQIEDIGNLVGTLAETNKNGKSLSGNAVSSGVAA